MRNPEPETKMQYSENDLVVDTLSGRLVGRVEYTAGGWAGVRDAAGRLDEYPAGRLVRAR